MYYSTYYKFMVWMLREIVVIYFKNLQHFPWVNCQISYG